MRVMISQPMRGLTQEEITNNRADVVCKLEKYGHEVVNTIFTETPPENNNQALWFLGKSLQAMAGVDAVLFMDGFGDARGCRIEHDACVHYGLQVLYQSQLL